MKLLWRVNVILFKIAASMFVGLVLIYAVKGLMMTRMYEQGHLLLRSDCDAEIDASVNDLCQGRICDESPSWWCSRHPPERDDR